LKIKPLYLFGAIVALVIAITLATIISFENDMATPAGADLVGFRQTKNLVIKSKVGSPFYGDTEFDSLLYFPENEGEVYSSEFYPIQKGEELDLMPDRPGYASHVVKGYVILTNQTWRDTLFVLKDLEEPSDTAFFAPFSDGTNGKETYGGGRYLDVTVKKGKPVRVDFNFAYNPWCAYKAEYICARIPGFNRMSKNIEAGEKQYPETHATP